MTCVCVPQPADADEPAALLHQQQWKWGGGRGREEGEQQHAANYCCLQLLWVSWNIWGVTLSPYCPSLLVKKGAAQVQKTPQPPAKPEKPKSRGFRNTLRNLRDRLRTDHRTPVRGPLWCSHVFLSSFQVKFTLWVSGSTDVLQGFAVSAG